MITILIALLLLAFILGVVPMDAQIKKLIIIVVTIAVVIWALPYLSAALNRLF